MVQLLKSRAIKPQVSVNEQLHVVKAAGGKESCFVEVKILHGPASWSFEGPQLRRPCSPKAPELGHSYWFRLYWLDQVRFGHKNECLVDSFAILFDQSWGRNTGPELHSADTVQCRPGVEHLFWMLGQISTLDFRAGTVWCFTQKTSRQKFPCRN